MDSPETTGFTTLYESSGAASFGLSLAQFTGLLQRHPADLHNNLPVRDLALAFACAEGLEQAWEYFLRIYRHRLYSAALTLAKDADLAGELVDVLIGDLFGVGLRSDGTRRSKLLLYTGRGSLDGWLRAIVVQTYVDQHRSRQRYTPLDETALSRLCTPELEAGTEVNPRLEPAIEAALARLSAESRFLLKAHFLDGCTFAEIGRMLGVHESTVSRRSSKLTKWLRREVLRNLRQQGMTRAAAEEALGADVRQLSIDVRRQLLANVQAIET